MSKRIELAGQRFGRWTVLSYAGAQKWHCRCACGTEKAVYGSSLRAGRSAGCLKCHPALGNRRTHGQSKTRLYNIWCGMIARCENPNERAFSIYGGRGVSVCAKWRASFESFRDWAIANGYSDVLTIDRYPNNSGDYEPGNCRWATYTEQNRNRRDNNPIVYQGRLVLISELAEKYDMPADVVKNRIRRYGWTIEDALTTPVRPRRKNIDALAAA